MIDADGVLRDVFLSDRRNPDEGVIYTASEAYLIRNGDGTTLIMVDGMAQRLEMAGKRLSTAKFRDFSFDISALVSSDKPRTQSIDAMTTAEMFAQWDQLETITKSSAGDIAEELTARFASAAFCMIAAMIGYATLVLGGFSRFGVWREIVIAFGLLIAIDGLRGTLVETVRDDASRWPLLFLPSLIGAGIVIGMIWQTAHPGWTKRMGKQRGVA